MNASPDPSKESEARITAWLLNELPPEERDAVETEIAQDASLSQLAEQLKRTIALLRDAASPAFEAARLSPERRTELLTRLSGPAIAGGRSARSGLFPWYVPLSAAACLILTFHLLIFVLPGIQQPRSGLAKNIPWGLEKNDGLREEPSRRTSGRQAAPSSEASTAPASPGKDESLTVTAGIAFDSEFSQAANEADQDHGLALGFSSDARSARARSDTAQIVESAPVHEEPAPTVLTRGKSLNELGQLDALATVESETIAEGFAGRSALADQPVETLSAFRPQRGQELSGARQGEENIRSYFFRSDNQGLEPEGEPPAVSFGRDLKETEELASQESRQQNRANPTDSFRPEALVADESRTWDYQESVKLADQFAPLEAAAGADLYDIAKAPQTAGRGILPRFQQNAANQAAEAGETRSLARHESRFAADNVALDFRIPSEDEIPDPPKTMFLMTGPTADGKPVPDPALPASRRKGIADQSLAVGGRLAEEARDGTALGGGAFGGAPSAAPAPFGEVRFDPAGAFGGAPSAAPAPAAQPERFRRRLEIDGADLLLESKLAAVDDSPADPNLPLIPPTADFEESDSLAIDSISTGARVPDASQLSLGLELPTGEIALGESLEENLVELEAALTPPGSIEARSRGRISKLSSLEEESDARGGEAAAERLWFQTPTAPEPAITESLAKAAAPARRPAKPQRPKNSAHYHLLQLARVQPVSTFSLNANRASFDVAAASLDHGRWPEPATVRPEEFYNAFNYREPLPVSDAPLAIHTEQASSPWKAGQDILRIAVRTRASGRPRHLPLNVVVLLDQSGSMERHDRRVIVQLALQSLAKNLQAQDRISIVGFARETRIWIDGSPGDRAAQELSRLSELVPEGGTNLELALKTAYELARKHYRPQGLNRVILLTDGAANLGNTETASLQAEVQRQRRSGIALDCFGIGWDGYDDERLEALTRNSDGRYAFLNRPPQVETDFHHHLTDALSVAARNVKVQLSFFPERVVSYRLIGFAKHRLNEEDFRDDTVDAAELSEAESGTALYAITIDRDGTGPVGELTVRYQDPESGAYRERHQLVPYRPDIPALESASPAMQLAAASGLFAERLALIPYSQGVELSAIAGLVDRAAAAFPLDPTVRQLQTMALQALSLESTRPNTP